MSQWKVLQKQATINAQRAGLRHSNADWRCLLPQAPSLLTLPVLLPSALPQSVKYNIPVAIWLPERYPLAGPLAYVVPTPDMVIKPRHTFVDASGASMMGPTACFALEAWHAGSFQTCTAGASILAWRCSLRLQTWLAASSPGPSRPLPRPQHHSIAS